MDPSVFFQSDMRLKSILILSITLTACVSTIDGQNLEKELSDWTFFSARSNLSFVERIKRDDGSIALTTYDTRSFQRKPNDVSIYIYPQLPCPITPRYMPIIHNIPAKHAQWGEVIFKPAWDPLPGENIVFCPAYEPMTASYAFCAEKGGKAVAICIQQVTDDEELAKQIFESFRWIDDN